MTTMAKANQVLVFLMAVLSIAGTTRGVEPAPSAFFCFGDSYADTGNLDHDSESWNFPYGITWPGYPTGRFGDGHIQTDYLADKMGLPSPTPYANRANQSIATGLNFALGGSGVTYAWGVLPLAAQVDQFELFLRTGAYSPSFLAHSVTLVSNVGNDYSPKYSTAFEYLKVAEEVVEGMTLALERLYNLGLRNILVSNLPPINCFPQSTALSNYTTCEAYVSYLILFHNGLLLNSIKKLNALPNANFLILDENAAFTYVQDNRELYGIKELLIPCCRPLSATDGCGGVDLEGNPRYTLCDDPSSYMYWDAVHVVESVWKHVVDLFYNETGYVVGETTLESWLSKNSLRPSAPASAPEQGGLQQGAAGPVEAAFQALISKPDYAESLGLSQGVDLDKFFAGKPDRVVTVFLPNNAAYDKANPSTILHVYGQGLVLCVAEFHVVEGYYESSQFPSSARNFTTVSGLDLLVTPGVNGSLVGPMNARVVEPDLYKMEGQLAVHGIDGILFPPNLQ